MHLLKARPSFQLRGVFLNFGVYDLSISLPHVVRWDKMLILTREALDNFHEAFAPNMTDRERKDPALSPLFADLRAIAAASDHKTLPPAFLSCGTEDPLLDDTVMFGAKLLMAGGKAVIKIYPGAPHAFTLIHHL